MFQSRSSKKNCLSLIRFLNLIESTFYHLISKWCLKCSFWEWCCAFFVVLSFFLQFFSTFSNFQATATDYVVISVLNYLAVILLLHEPCWCFFFSLLFCFSISISSLLPVYLCASVYISLLKLIQYH